MKTYQKTLNQLIVATPNVALHRGDGETVITALAFDSRKVGAGTLFIAVAGAKHDGHDFVRGAIGAGAAGVVVQSGREGDFADAGVPVIAAADTRSAMAHLAVAFYNKPSAKLHLAGVTGTNGKTTTALMMESIARANGDKTAYIGTLGFGINGVMVEGERTTPEAIDLQAFLARCVDEGVTAVCMEVSSHALATGRVAGCLFDLAVFTNLTQDHLDFHGTMEAYRDAKGLLFGKYADIAHAAGKNYKAVLNADDIKTTFQYMETLETILPEVDGRKPVILYSLSQGFHLKRALTSYDVKLLVDNICYTAIVWKDKFAYAEADDGDIAYEVPVELGFGGTFNVENSLAAVGYGVARGLTPDVIAAGLRTCAPVPGRFEPVKAGQDFAVLVDYAHTPDGLDNVLKSARPLTTGKLIAVFGCGGDRDKTKRPLMGAIAKRLADVAIATSDNPRTENPEAILDDVMAGMTEGGAIVHRVADRRQAIALAVTLAAPGDTIVIAGKGHETYQLIGTETFPFDDVAVAREEIERATYRAAKGKK